MYIDVVMCMDLNHFSAACQLHLYFHYLPVFHSSLFVYPTTLSKEKKVEDIGVEPMTPCVQGRCSSQLS